MDYHPYANAFPMLPDDKLQELAEDIQNNGQLNPIICDQHDRIVDGRNRYEACGLVGIEVTYETKKLTDEQALALVQSANLQRRQLTPTQAAEAALKLANLGHGGHNKSKRPPGRLLSTKPVSQAEACKATGASERSLRRLKKVKKNGTEELQQAVSDDAIGLETAEAVCTAPPEEQHAAVENAKQKKLSPKRKPKTNSKPKQTVGVSWFKEHVQTALKIGRVTQDRFWRELQCESAGQKKRFLEILNEVPYFEIREHDNGSYEMLEHRDQSLMAALRRETTCLQNAFKSNFKFEPAIVRKKAQDILKLLS